MNPKCTYYKNGQLHGKKWWFEDKLHRVDGPAYRLWDENGQLMIESWWIGGKLHRVDGPAVQYWNENGQLRSEVWHVDGKDVPAFDPSSPLDWLAIIAQITGDIPEAAFVFTGVSPKLKKNILAGAILL